MKTICFWLNHLGIEHLWLDAREVIKTDGNHRKAKENWALTQAAVEEKIGISGFTLTQGFIGSDTNNFTTTLGREGSDYTAAIIAAVMNASILEIWTDVSGMFTTNPKLIKNAKPIQKLSYLEAIELSHFGAKVLYPPTVQPVLDLNIPIHIKNTLDPESVGTIISNNHINSGIPVKGISNINNIALLTLQGSGMIGIPGFSKRLFETLSQEKINVILITQASSEHSICIGIDDKDADLAKNAIDNTFENEIALNKIDPIIVETNLSIIALIGDNMKNHQGISGKMFSSLGKNNINIRAIAQGASEKNISAVILQNDVKKAYNMYLGNNLHLINQLN